MDGALQNHGALSPERIGHKVQAGHEGLGQDAGLQRQVIVAGQQQEQSGKQGCTVALLIDHIPVALVQGNGGCHAVDRIGSHQDVQKPLIDKRIGIAAVVGNQLVLQNGHQAAQEGKEKDNQISPQLQFCFLLTFQLQKLLSGQVLEFFGVGRIFHRTPSCSLFLRKLKRKSGAHNESWYTFTTF